MQKINIKANPSKTFFIEMLTRDIGLIDCVLDLIDNSIDSIIKTSGFDPMKGLFAPGKSLEKYKIAIDFNKSYFSINDNSTGVTRRDAENRVFRFGTDKMESSGVGLSVYGIGMKRSFLKIGKTINFRSRNSKETIEVDIDVDNWLNADGWDFEGKIDKKSKFTGTTISISNLCGPVSTSFNESPFETKLIEKISEVYGIFLLNKLKIEVNDLKIKPTIPKIATSNKLKPAIDTFKIDDVKVKLIAGLTHEEAKNLNGWYVFCNGRLILSGDKTYKTGWGSENLRQFHPSVSRFLGFAYFESEKVSSLPWTTTKDDVNEDSKIYRHALNEMVKTAQPIVSYLTKLYAQDKSMEIIRDMINKTDEASISALKTEKQLFTAPTIASIHAKNSKERIAFLVPEKDIKKAKKIIGNDSISNPKIGEKAFYFFLEYSE